MGRLQRLIAVLLAFSKTALLEELIDQAQAAITDIRRLVYNLRPPAPDDLGLLAAIRGQAMSVKGPSTIICTDSLFRGNINTMVNP